MSDETSEAMELNQSTVERLGVIEEFERQFTYLDEIYEYDDDEMQEDESKEPHSPSEENVGSDGMFLSELLAKPKPHVTVSVAEVYPDHLEVQSDPELTAVQFSPQTDSSTSYDPTILPLSFLGQEYEILQSTGLPKDDQDDQYTVGPWDSQSWKVDIYNNLTVEDVSFESDVTTASYWVAKWTANAARLIIFPTDQYEVTGLTIGFVHNIIVQCDLSRTTILLGLVYLERRFEGLGPVDRNLSNDFVLQNMVTIALLISNYFSNDKPSKVTFWAIVTRIPRGHLQALMRDWLRELKWGLFPNRAIIDRLRIYEACCANALRDWEATPPW